MRPGSGGLPRVSEDDAFSPIRIRRASQARIVVSPRPTGFVARTRVLVWRAVDAHALDEIPAHALLFPHGPTDTLRRAALRDPGVAGAIVAGSSERELGDDVVALRTWRPRLRILALTSAPALAEPCARLGVASLADGSPSAFVRSSCLALARTLLEVESWGSRWHLTASEAEVLARAACGTPRARLHELMGRAPSTVDTWARSVVEKSELEDFAEAVDHVVG